MFMSTLFFISFVFLIILFIVYFGHMSSIARLFLKCIRPNTAHPSGHRMSGRHYVSMVLIYIVYLWISPNVSGRVLDHIGDSYVESFVVHPPYIGLVGPSLKGEEDSNSNSPKLMLLMQIV
jgi:hypothetical protein